jgi:hypothetical protein
MLFRETVAVYCENHAEHTYTLCGQHAECYVYVKADDIYSDHWVLKGYSCCHHGFCLEGLRKTTSILRIADVQVQIQTEKLQNMRLELYRHANPFDLRRIISALPPDIFVVSSQRVLDLFFC